MPSVTKILAADVPVGQSAEISIPGLRQGDIKPGTRILTVDGVEQPEAKYSLDLTFQKITASNEGPIDWLAGSELLLTWDGVMIEAAIIDLDDRVVVLEANMGVVDGSNAQPGQIGEYLSVDNTIGITPVANTPMAVCSIDLPSGCWEIWGACDFTIVAGADTQAGAPVQPNQLAASISLSPDGLPTQDDLIVGTGVMNLIYSPLAAGQRQVLITGQCRSNSIEPLSLYLVAAVGSANANVKGYVSARRVR